MFRSLALFPVLLLAASGGCNGPASSPDKPASPAVVEAATGEPVVLAVGEAVEIEGHALRYVDLVEDSRCPTDVTCVWSGRAKVRLSASAPEGEEASQVLTLPYDTMTEDESATWAVGGVVVELLDVRPAPGTDATGVPRQVEIRVTPEA